LHDPREGKGREQYDNVEPGSAEMKLKKIRARQQAAIAAHRAAKTDAKQAYWQQHYNAALDAEDERSLKKSSAWIEDYAQAQLGRARASAPWNTPANNQTQNVPPASPVLPPVVASVEPTKGAPSPLQQPKEKSRRGPKPGAINRFAKSDRAFYPEIARRTEDDGLSRWAVCYELAQQGKLLGLGGSTEESRARRLYNRYPRDKNSLTPKQWARLVDR